MKSFTQWLNEAKEEFLKRQEIGKSTGQKPIEEVAEEFINYAQQKYPGKPIGIVACPRNGPGSGNCAWTARQFYLWANLKHKQNPQQYSTAQLLWFPDNENEPSGHLVPVYNGSIIDYIQMFTNGKRYHIIKLANTSNGQHNIKENPQIAKIYDTYQQYYIGNSMDEIDSYGQKYYKAPDYKTSTFEKPINPKRVDFSQLGYPVNDQL